MKGRFLKTSQNRWLSKKFVKSPFCNLALRKNCLKQSFSGSYIPAFELTTEIYGVHLGFQSNYGKIQARKN